MSHKVQNVHCKMCDRDFDRLEWLTNKECDKPELCHCPEVQKAMKKANQAINKAKNNTGAWNVEKRVTSIPTQRKEDVDQLFISKIEPLMVIEITKKKRP